MVGYGVYGNTGVLLPILQTFKNVITNFKHLGELPKTDRDESSGLIVRKENPDVLLRDLPTNIEIYDEMLEDDRIKFSLNLKKRLILAVNADILPASNDEKDKEIAEEVENQLKIKKTSKYEHNFNYSFWNMLDNGLDAMAYGFKVAEKVFKIPEQNNPNNFIVLNNLKYRHSDQFDFDYDPEGNLDNVILGRRTSDEVETKGIENIKHRYLIFTYPYAKDGNQYGDSDLREIYRQFRSKQHIQKQRDIYLEKYGTPIPEIIYDTKKTNPAEKIAIEELLQNFQEGSYMIIPGYTNQDGELRGKFKFTLHEAKNATATDQFEKAIDQIDKQITRNMLIADKLGFSESPGGSFNQATIHKDILLGVIEHSHGWIEEIVNPMIREIVDFNFANVETYPVFKFDKISDKIEKELLKILIDTGIVDSRESWIRKHVSIPTLTKEEQDELERTKEEVQPPNEPNPKTEDNPEIDGKKPEDEDAELKKVENAWEKKVNKNYTDEQHLAQILFQSRKNPFDSKAAKTTIERIENTFIENYLEIQRLNAEDLIRQIENKKIIENKDRKAMKTLRINKPALKKQLENTMADSFVEGKIGVIKEVKPRMDSLNLTEKLKSNLIEFQGEEKTNAEIKKELNKLGSLGVLTKEDAEELRRIREKAFFITGVEEERMLKETFFIIDDGIKTNKTVSEVTSQLRGVLKKDRERFALTIARNNIADEFNRARNIFTSSDAMKPFVEAFQYQAIIDDRTTPFCTDHDGQIIKPGDGQLLSIQPPNHHQCRSVLVAILVGESDQSGFFQNYENRLEVFGAGVGKDALNPEQGFGGTGNKL